MTFGILASAHVPFPVVQPDDIPGLELWLDASDASTITATGSNVTAWADKSAAGNDCTTVRGTGNPQTASSTQNSLNVVEFSGAHDIGRASSYHNLANNHLTVISAFQVTGAGTFAAAPLSLTRTNGGKPYDYWHSATTKTVYIGGGSSASSNWASIRSTSFMVLTVQCEYNPSANHTVTHRVNGVQVHSATVTGSWFQDGYIRVGRRDDGATTFIGKVGEVLAYDALVGTSDIESLESYLSSKWGV